MPSHNSRRSVVKLTPPLLPLQKIRPESGCSSFPVAGDTEPFDRCRRFAPKILRSVKIRARRATRMRIGVASCAAVRVFSSWKGLDSARGLRAFLQSSWRVAFAMALPSDFRRTRLRRCLRAPYAFRITLRLDFFWVWHSLRTSSGYITDI